MAVATDTLKDAPARPALSSKAREMMEQLNTDAAKSFVWVRTQMNSPAQRPWFTDSGGVSGAGQMASGRVAANQLKTAAHRWRWKEYNAYLERIAGIASKADVSPIEFADRQSILLTNPGLGGRLQVTNTIRCAISIYNPGDIAPAHVHSPNASRTILSDKGGYTNVEGERCDASRGDIIITPNGTWHDHGNDGTVPVIWIDMLDWPLMEFLDCAWVDQDFQPGSGSNAKSQEAVHTKRLLQPALRQRRHGADLHLPSARLRTRPDPDDFISAAPASARRSKGCARRRATRTKASRWSSSIRSPAGRCSRPSTTRPSCCGPARPRCPSARPRAPSSW